jgi:hypothetical protein
MLTAAAGMRPVVTTVRGMAIAHLASSVCHLLIATG